MNRFNIFKFPFSPLFFINLSIFDRVQSVIFWFISLPAIITEWILSIVGYPYSISNLIDHRFPHEYMSNYYTEFGKEKRSKTSPIDQNWRFKNLRSHRMEIEKEEMNEEEESGFKEEEWKSIRDRTAFSMLFLCALSYEKTIAIDSILAQLGYNNIRFIGYNSTTDYPVFITSNENHIVVCFRGTDPLSVFHWFQNFKVGMVDIDSINGIYGRVHRGFWSALVGRLEKAEEKAYSDANIGYHHRRPLANHIFHKIQKLQTELRRPVYFTGHSLGGSLAILMAMWMVRQGHADDVGGVFTYGQPRVGDPDLSRSLSNSSIGHRMYRYVNNNDMVPRFPPNMHEIPLLPASISAIFAHNIRGYSETIGTCLYIDKDGSITENREKRAPALQLPWLITSWLRVPIDVFFDMLKRETYARMATRFFLHQSIIQHFTHDYFTPLLKQSSYAPHHPFVLREGEEEEEEEVIEGRQETEEAISHALKREKADQNVKMFNEWENYAFKYTP